MKDESGFSLMEVMLAMVLLIIISASFVGAYAASYSSIHRGKEITRDTFEAQEEIEKFIIAIDIEDPAVTEKDYIVFGRTVTGHTVEQDIKGSRVFYTYVSDEDILSPVAPQIQDVVVKAYAGSGSTTQTFPWFGSELRVEYTDTDPLIFGEIHRWYKSELDAGNQPILEPKFPVHYEKVKDDDFDPETGKVLEQTYTQGTQDPGRYIVYGVTPFSEVGKMGREARNDMQQILIMDNPNNYWGNFIEEVYLDQFNVGNLLRRNDYTDIHTYTTQNQERLTLNVETELTTKKPGSFIYAEIPSAHLQTIFLEVIVEAEIDETSYINSGNNIGYGIFIGEADTQGKDSGFMVEFDAGNNLIYLQKMVSGNYESGFTPIAKALSLNWDEEVYELVFEINKLNNSINVAVKDSAGVVAGNIIFSPEEVGTFNYDNQYLGIKTWSEVKHIDESLEIQVGQRAMSAHFYGIQISDFEGLASGGNDVYVETIDGTNYVFHVFNSPGSHEFIVNENINVDVLIVGGGGGGAGSTGNTGRGGGGAGGIVHIENSSLNEGQYSIVVGDGGPGGPAGGGNGTSGENTSFNGIAAIGGGYGSTVDGGSGGSGGSGGGVGVNNLGYTAGTGLQPTAVHPGYGYSGGHHGSYEIGSGAGGGGGAGALGGSGGNGSTATGGSGGYGRNFSLLFGTKYGEGGWFGGGGGGSAGGTGGSGGDGGGGNGSNNTTNPGSGLNGTGGGGGGSQNGAGGSGGSGIVIIRYTYTY